MPEISVGIRDIGGTSINGAEYIVANKKFSNLDITLGLGWGALSSFAEFDNPFVLLNSGFSKRVSNQKASSTGKFSANNFFRGEKVGLFGGISYQFEDFPIVAHLELNPNRYDFDIDKGALEPSSKWTVGFDWGLPVIGR